MKLLPTSAKLPPCRPTEKVRVPRPERPPFLPCTSDRHYTRVFLEAAAHMCRIRSICLHALTYTIHFILSQFFK